jgi:superfamily II DNA or RNA helicase
MSATYLGYKGYTIYKECLTLHDINYIKKTLNVKPFIPNSFVKTTGFPVYRESSKKLYIPRYFGINNYGLQDEQKIDDGENININFKGQLRDYQINIVDTYLNSLNSDYGGGGLLEIPCGRGKTIMALNIISKLKKKTLVIVHKGFLLNQWVERIQEFLPNSKIGKIQGQIIDIDGKDIVIGMLQSLSMKEYPDNMFNCFGLTIVDECHHISSEVFSRSLLKIITKYTLGLSATMQRKDGLTKVFKMFLGDIVYSEKRESDNSVLVKGIKYYSNDDEFNDVLYDFRGSVQYSSMITKLSKYENRSNFIIEVIKKELINNKNQQIMILGHYKSLLVYLYKVLNREHYSVGYYVGGMKDVDLKISEKKQIIIATYAMASEALDIKSLTTLILATPKTDITQAVGRILRTKHEQPLVIDIIDVHNIFENQWKKRLSFYKKNNYKIITTTNTNYKLNIWEEYKIKKKNKKCMINIV